MGANRGGITPRLVLGVALIILGAAFWLDELRIVDVGSVIRLWPLAPIAVGLSMALQRGGSGNRVFGGLLVVGGVWVLLFDFDIIGFSFWDVWPVVLIGLGGWIVWRSMYGSEEAFLGPHAPDVPAGDPRASSEDAMSVFAFVGHVERSSSSRNFQGADLTAIMGGCTIDLRGADIGPGGAVIDAFAFWGGVKILVPEEWVVTNKVLPLLGGSEDRSRAVAGATRQLLVRGSSIMGGVEIANHDDDDH